MTIVLFFFRIFVDKFKEIIGKWSSESCSYECRVNSRGNLEVWNDGEIDEKSIIVTGNNLTRDNNGPEASDSYLFTIDTKPVTKDQNDLDIPTYKVSFFNFFYSIIKRLFISFKQLLCFFLQQYENTEDETKRNAPPRMSCFNCLGSHNLNNCPEPKDYVKINKNRKEFASKAPPRSSRYHLDDDQKFSHFVPGQMSSNLRRALGLAENDLPLHIYRYKIH